MFNFFSVLWKNDHTANQQSEPELGPVIYLSLYREPELKVPKSVCGGVSWTSETLSEAENPSLISLVMYWSLRKEFGQFPQVIMNIPAYKADDNSRLYFPRKTPKEVPKSEPSQSSLP